MEFCGRLKEFAYLMAISIFRVKCISERVKGQKVTGCVDESVVADSLQFIVL